MTQPLRSPRLQHLIFMKVDNHAGEALWPTLHRKRKEIDDTGMSFWGYGGATCHPLKQVLPLLAMAGDPISVPFCMEFINSPYVGTTSRSTEYSADGRTWLPIPTGINVTGSKRAIVMSSLEDASWDLDLSEYEVAVGNCAGQSALDYIFNRVDKACLTRSMTKREPKWPRRTKPVRHISQIGTLKAPYAVLVR
jgi:hypothetical protein